jgi:hypothetical protein
VNGSSVIDGITVSGNRSSSAAMTVFKGMINVGEQANGSGGTTRNISITGNTCRGLLRYMVNLGGGGTDPLACQNISVTGNSFDGRMEGSATLASDNESAFLQAGAGVRELSVVGNTVSYTGRSGIRAEGVNVIIANNVIRYAAQNDLSAPTPVREAGIYIFNPARNVSLLGNTIYNSHNAALNASYVTGGIVLESSDTVLVAQVIGNTVVEDRTGSEGMEYGIKVGVSVTAWPDEVVVKGNVIRGTSNASGISESGTGTHTITWNSIGADDTKDDISAGNVVADSLRANTAFRTAGDVTIDPPGNEIKYNNGSGFIIWNQHATGSTSIGAKNTSNVIVMGSGNSSVVYNWPIVPQTVTFATLPGTPINGMVVYCSDCTKATPTASGGTGALVVRINGAWDGNP